VANPVELSMVVESQLGPDGARQSEAFLRHAGVIVDPVALEHGAFARQAFLDFGRGRHKAAPNFCDCFAYALARATGEALLFKGDDFALTDIRRA
jgi:ribonuclease VapC